MDRLIIKCLNVLGAFTSEWFSVWVSQKCLTYSQLSLEQALCIYIRLINNCLALLLKALLCLMRI